MGAARNLGREVKAAGILRERCSIAYPMCEIKTMLLQNCVDTICHTAAISWVIEPSHTMSRVGSCKWAKASTLAREIAQRRQLHGNEEESKKEETLTVSETESSLTLSFSPAS